MRKGTVTIDVNDIVGKHSGNLEVVRYLGHDWDVTSGGERLRHYYGCKCKCGKMTVVQRGNLQNESTRSCGCSRRGKRNGN